MELHRIKEYQSYDRILFNRIYKETEPLRKKLSYQIDARRIGVDHNQIMSYFDDKFLLAYQKYVGKYTEPVLKGHILSALSNFKNRLCRYSYTQKMGIYRDAISMDFLNLENVPDQKLDDSLYITLVTEFFKEKLTQDAYLIFDIQTNPPLYITSKTSNIYNIPSKLICDFLGLESTQATIKYVNSLKNEIKGVKEMAIEHFAPMALVS